jgi:putative membrane protein
MLLCLGAILFTASDIDNKRLKYLFIAWLVGYLIEVAGVNTGLIFGSYHYGSALGLKFFNTPLMIGINWFLLCYTVNQIIEKIFSRSLFTIVLSATIITAFDYIIEPDATRLGMWSWLNNDVPIQNYVAWWFTAFFLSAIYYYLQIPFQRISYWILGAMLVFFLSA